MQQKFHLVVTQVSQDISTQNKLNAFDIWYQMFWPFRVVKKQHYFLLHKIEVFIIMTLRGFNESNENESIGVHYERNVKTIIEQKVFILQITELRSLLKIQPNFFHSHIRKYCICH